MYGGHDGGFSRHGQQNYIPGHEFEELWAMELDTKRWRLLHASLPDDQPGPGKRYLAAAAAVDNRILLYGGLSQGQGDGIDLSSNVHTDTA
ncbi:predicted protein [Haematococcus lacustris]|uniref:Uncharacterized protein n=1 Tax=Haematococcus lacustris TaxID=44745 RepID=A0A699ZDF7_HAELA|nr:predicted protein [Haematococcus lacustris]